MATYYVSPRYTQGFARLVCQTEAEHIANAEREGYGRHLGGSEGPEARVKAQQFGLRGIVELRTERVVRKQRLCEIYDLCTQERYIMPSSMQLKKLGYRPYEELGARLKAEIDADPPAGMGDWRRNGWFKPFGYGGGFEVYAPEMLPPKGT